MLARGPEGQMSGRLTDLAKESGLLQQASSSLLAWPERGAGNDHPNCPGGPAPRPVCPQVKSLLGQEFFGTR
jgi:hypothetical protein